MLSHTLDRIERVVAKGDFVVTLHADEELRADRLTGQELRSALLSGHIVERQLNEGSGESKFRIRGRTHFGAEVEVICRLSPRQKVIIITVYRI